MNEARVYADGFERSFAEVKDLLEFLAERGRNAKWIRKPTNTLRLAPLEKEAQNLDAADASMEEILEDTEKNTQLVLKMRGESYPVRDCAIRTILSRAGVNGDGLRKLDNLSFGEDFQFIACKGADEAAEIVRRIYLDEIAKNGMDQVQILTPYRKRSAAGVDELNKSLEDFVNPPIAGKKELHIGSQVFRVGDKILQNKNTEMASNGDLGRILDCITDEDGNARAVIGFPDGRQVQYEADQMEMIEHANATTIHKAQGSECPVVIIPWVKAFYMMLKRNILYTGVTRAKSKVYLVGEWAAVCQAIHTDDSGTRNTILSDRIVQYYDQYQSEQKPEMEQLKLVV